MNEVNALSIFMTLGIYVGSLLLLIFGGMPVLFVLGAIAVGSIFLGGGSAWAGALGYVSWTSMTNFTIVAIPMFVFMGYILFESGVSGRIYDAFYPLLDRLVPGGLLHTNIVVGAVFAACTGSSAASAASIGAVSLPELEKRGYNVGLSVGSMAAGGTLGGIIPPSVPLVVYGAMTMVSVGKLLIGGIIPGLILASAYSGYIALRVKFQPNLVPEQQFGRKSTLAFCLRNTLQAWPVIILVLTVLGSIYVGVATPTEAAALGVVSSIILAILYRGLNLNTIKIILKNTINTSCMILGIMWAASLMSVYLSNSGLTRELVHVVTNSGLSPLAILMVIYLFYLILGMLMDGLAALVMTLPITFPIISGLGFDPVWFGVVMTIFCAMALITPPVGLIIFIVQGLRPEYSYKSIIGGILPFFGIMLITIILLTIFPSLVTFLPDLMITR